MKPIKEEKKKIEHTQNDLDSLVRIYFLNNENKKVYTKKVADLGGQIKKLMKDGEITELVVGDIKASYGISKKKDFDWDQVLNILKENLTEEQITKVIKTQEYVDQEALDSMIYHKEFDIMILAPAQTVEETVKLVVSKVKGQLHE